MNNPFFTGLTKPAGQDFGVNPQPGIQGGYDTGPQFSFQRDRRSHPSFTQDQSGVGAIGTTISSMVPNKYDGEFSVDPNAGFKGSFGGLSSGGAVGAIIGGVTAQVGQFSKVNMALKNLDTSVEGVTYDGYGSPTYNGGAYADATNKVNELNQGEKSMKLGLDPATYVFGSIMGTRKKLRKRRDQVKANMVKAQADYNKAEGASRLRNNAMEDYQQRMNAGNRMRNVYRQQFGV